MEEFTIINLFINDSDLFELRLVLGQNEIEFTLLDENTLQVLPGYSHALGGVRLQVKIEDAEKTIQILEEHGFIEKEKPLPIVTFFDKITSKIPFIKNLRLELRIISLVSFIVLFAALLPLPNYLRTQEAKIIQTRWCLSKIEYQNQIFTPKTIEPITITYKDDCDEAIEFGDSYKVVFPGFDSRKIRGNWETYKGYVEISNVDTLSEMLNGTYKISLNRKGLILTSETTTIFCYSSNNSAIPSIRVD